MAGGMANMSAYMITSMGLSYLYLCHSKHPDSVICNTTQHNLSSKTAVQVNDMHYLCVLGGVLEDGTDLVRQF